MKLLLSIFALVLTAGCASVSTSNLAPELPTEKAVETYTVGIGDQLNINVWKNPELSMTVAVRPDGKISLPLAGDIEAAGVSANDLTTSITNNLKRFIRNPQVTVIVTNAGSVDYLLRVRVTGAVNAPLSVAHKDGMTVLDLVLEAGGPTQFASLNNAKLYRRIGGEIKVYDIRLGDILNKGKLGTNYKLAPSDIVTIPERIF